MALVLCPFSRFLVCLSSSRLQAPRFIEKLTHSVQIFFWRKVTSFFFFLANICHRDSTFLKYLYVSASPLLSTFASADVCAANLSKPVLSASYLQKKCKILYVCLSDFSRTLWFINIPHSRKRECITKS